VLPRSLYTLASFPLKPSDLKLIYYLSMVAYRYDELPPDAFRYLVLQPGLSDEPLSCSLHVSRIDEVKYESVSYAWGTGQRDQDIVCDDKILKITPNLYSVLQRVRLPDAPRNLWADSICINQEDLEEKGRQVTIMGQIYRSAERVLICMGATGEEHGPNVSSLLHDINKMIDDGFATISDMIEGRKRDGEWDDDWDPWDQFPHSDVSAPVLHDPRWRPSMSLWSKNGSIEAGSFGKQGWHSKG
jgi:hypothetical protein